VSQFRQTSVKFHNKESIAVVIVMNERMNEYVTERTVTVTVTEAPVLHPY